MAAKKALIFLKVSLIFYFDGLFPVYAIKSFKLSIFLKNTDLVLKM